MGSNPPLWRQAYDAAERVIAPQLEALVRSSGFKDATGLSMRVQKAATDLRNDVAARIWHLANLPAGTDVRRLRTQLGSLDRKMRRLTLQLDQQLDADAERTTAHGNVAEPDVGRRPDTPRGGTQHPASP